MCILQSGVSDWAGDRTNAGGWNIIYKAFYSTEQVLLANLIYHYYASFSQIYSLRSKSSWAQFGEFIPRYAPSIALITIT